ncbi:Nif3-like dinuclear metal center hexameric protein [Candidatus Wirthbacteria bacterium CG2_30_54_11]|uniref:Nif3-like dinuclear metal center hexameric protein n=1 Tax=Candidatus Wirthbacteria bacterium CG2_30_54_11 TaxID=1817892 RepID=A0A1J5IZ65_9BACT|nr:MAG: Nif3-like dinuclear metal center hexameric protein [Candidatus Wirthbacteria bacterium CG2_30_54_11]
MANRDDILNFCDSYLQIEKYRDYGPKGLQFLGKAEVKKVVTGVSVSLDLFTAAAAAGADMVLVHHGEYWQNLSQKVGVIRKRRLQVLFQHDMTLAGYHLPLDAHREIGNNVLLVKQAGFDLDEQPFGIFDSMPIGARGSSKGLKLTDVVERLEKLLGTRALVFSFGPQTVKTAGFISGGGAEGLLEAIDQGLDLFVTGESKEQSFHLAKEAGINLIYAHHYNSEKLGIQALGEKVKEKFGVEHEFIDIPCPL